MTEERCEESCSSVLSDTAALLHSLKFFGGHWTFYAQNLVNSSEHSVISLDRLLLFTWHSSLSSSCCNLIWEHQLSSSSLLTAEKTNIHFKLFHIHVVFRHLTFLSVFWPGKIKCLIIHSYRLIKAWPHILPVVGVAEWETGDMQTWLWTLRAHRLPLLCVAVCCTAVTSLLQRKP